MGPIPVLRHAQRDDETREPRSMHGTVPEHLAFDRRRNGVRTTGNS